MTDPILAPLVELVAGDVEAYVRGRRGAAKSARQRGSPERFYDRLFDRATAPLVMAASLGAGGAFPSYTRFLGEMEAGELGWALQEADLDSVAADELAAAAVDAAYTAGRKAAGKDT